MTAALKARPLSVDELCQLGKLTVVQDPAELAESLGVESLRALEAAGPRDLAFFFSRYYQAELLQTHAGCIVTGKDFVEPLRKAAANGQLPVLDRAVLLVAEDPYLALARLSHVFAQRSSSVVHDPHLVQVDAQIDPTAWVAPDVQISSGVRVGRGCVVESGSRLGAGVVLYPHCFVGPHSVIGENSVLFPQVTLYEGTQIGARVRIHAGSTLGADGFGYAPRSVDGKPVEHVKIYHLGFVRVGDDVEIGAQVTIDRGTLSDTVIGSGAKIDNKVHIGHNSQVGEGAILCGGICLAGNARVGRFAYLGGMSGVVNQVQVGDYAQVGAMSLVTKDVDPGQTVMGNPQREGRDHFKAHAALNRLLRKGSSK